MSSTLLEMISQAAAQANDQITAVQKGEYRPKVDVITAGRTRHGTVVTGFGTVVAV